VLACGAMPSDATTSSLAGLVAALRELTASAVNVAAPAEALDRARRHVEQATAALLPHVADPPIPRYPALGTLDLGASPNDFMPYDPVLGRLSPLAPPIALRFEDGKAIGEVTFGKPYEGPPGCVHGGVLALAFDQVLSMGNLCQGIAGPTATLQLRFRRPTPLGVPVRFEGWRERHAGRRLHACGRALVDGVVTVEAEGTFVHLPRERVMALLPREEPQP